MRNLFFNILKTYFLAVCICVDMSSTEEDDEKFMDKPVDLYVFGQILKFGCSCCRIHVTHHGLLCVTKEKTLEQEPTKWIIEWKKGESFEMYNPKSANNLYKCKKLLENIPLCNVCYIAKKISEGKKYNGYSFNCNHWMENFCKELKENYTNLIWYESVICPDFSGSLKFSDNCKCVKNENDSFDKINDWKLREQK